MTSTVAYAEESSTCSDVSSFLEARLVRRIQGRMIRLRTTAWILSCNVMRSRDGADGHHWIEYSAGVAALSATEIW